MSTFIIAGILTTTTITLGWMLYLWFQRIRAEKHLSREIVVYLEKHPMGSLPRQGSLPSVWEALRDKMILDSRYPSSRTELHPVRLAGRVVVTELPMVPTTLGRWMYTAPTILTMAGIWGTFWGVSTGLGQAGLTKEQSTQGLMKGAQTLFIGMETAFDTSLWGLGAAMLVVLAMSIFRYLHQVQVEMLERELRDVCVVQDPDNYLSTIDATLHDINQTLKQATASPLSNGELEKTERKFVDIGEKLEDTGKHLEILSDLATKLARHSMDEDHRQELPIAISEIIVQLDDMLERKFGDQNQFSSSSPEPPSTEKEGSDS